jgi:hypothetical protein
MKWLEAWHVRSSAARYIVGEGPGITATHILCECEALAYFRLRHLGQYFMEPSDYFDVPTYKILRFIRSAGLLRGQSEGEAQ